MFTWTKLARMRTKWLGMSVLLATGCSGKEQAGDAGLAGTTEASEAAAADAEGASDGGAAGTSDAAQCQDPIVFEDPAVESAVRLALDAGAGDITAAQAAGFYYSISVDHVSSLKGLECVVNLLSFSSNGGTISDLSPLAGLARLVSVEIPNNQVSSLAPLSGNPELSNIGARNNRIENLSGLTLPSVGGKACAWLDLTGNPIGLAELEPACSAGWYVTYGEAEGGGWNVASCVLNDGCISL